jgi:large subunit ribosomal protein L18
MNKEKIKKAKRERRHARIRVKVKGTDFLPRLSVFKSNKGMYLQLIDDLKGKTIVSAASSEIKLEKKDKEDATGYKTRISFELGKLIAKKAKDKKIEAVVFDRGGYKYHGRVKAAADGARENGLIF